MTSYTFIYEDRGINYRRRIVAETKRDAEKLFKKNFGYKIIDCFETPDVKPRNESVKDLGRILGKKLNMRRN